MEKIIKTIALLTMLSVVVLSCKKKDEEPAAKTNFATIDGTEYSLSQGYTSEWISTRGNNFDLIVGSSGFDYSDITNVGLKGKGDILYFSLWSTSDAGLVTGSYSYSDTEKPNTYTDIFVATNYDAATEKSDSKYESGTGTVTINVDGDTYSIDFDITLAGGKKMTGNFTGKLPNYK